MKFRAILGCLAFQAAASLTSASFGAVLLNDTWADGDRTNTNLPTDSPTWIGQSTGNGSNSVSPGSLNFTLPTNSLKVWEYFTSDNSAPDTNQPHNSVTQLAVNERMTATIKFVPSGLTNPGTTSRNFRVGLFHDPTSARVASNVNSDAGGSGNPWQDATGYMVQIPLNGGTGSGNNPLSIAKRTNSDNTSLAGSSSSFTAAPSGGSAYTMSSGTEYTLSIEMTRVSASQMDITATVLDGTTVLSSLTQSDTGTAMGGTALAGTTLLPSATGVYSSFDQLFIRNSDATQAAGLSFTNFRIETSIVPEPASLGLLVLFGAAMLRRRQ